MPGMGMITVTVSCAKERVYFRNPADFFEHADRRSSKTDALCP